MSYNSNPEKSFNVVFERQTPMSDEETQSDYPVLNTHTKIMIRDVTKQALRKRYEELQSQQEVATKFSRLLNAVGHSSVQENKVTDKFVTDVEQMMNCFGENIGKLQATYKSIMDKLPKVESNK